MEQFKGQPRLPKFATPKRYDIRLKPDLAACKFAGTVAVDVDVVGETKFIVLNAADLTIRDGTVSFTAKASSQVKRLDLPGVPRWRENRRIVLCLGFGRERFCEIVADFVGERSLGFVVNLFI